LASSLSYSKRVSGGETAYPAGSRQRRHRVTRGECGVQRVQLRLYIHQPTVRRPPVPSYEGYGQPYSDGKVANRNARFGTGGDREWALERGTNPKHSHRTCSCEYGLPSWRGKSAGVAKRPRERSPTRNPDRHDSQLLHRCTPSSQTLSRGTAATRRITKRV
jgi:hypothetical protein